MIRSPAKKPRNVHSLLYEMVLMRTCHAIPFALVKLGWFIIGFNCVWLLIGDLPPNSCTFNHLLKTCPLVLKDLASVANSALKRLWQKVPQAACWCHMSTFADRHLCRSYVSQCQVYGEVGRVEKSSNNPEEIEAVAAKVDTPHSSRAVAAGPYSCLPSVSLGQYFALDFTDGWWLRFERLQWMQSLRYPCSMSWEKRKPEWNSFKTEMGYQRTNLGSSQKKLITSILMD